MENIKKSIKAVRSNVSEIFTFYPVNYRSKESMFLLSDLNKELINDKYYELILEGKLIPGKLTTFYIEAMKLTSRYALQHLRSYNRLVKGDCCSVSVPGSGDNEDQLKLVYDNVLKFHKCLLLYLIFNSRMDICKAISLKDEDMQYINKDNVYFTIEDARMHHYNSCPEIKNYYDKAIKEYTVFEKKVEEFLLRNFTEDKDSYDFDKNEKSKFLKDLINLIHYSPGFKWSDMKNKECVVGIIQNTFYIEKDDLLIELYSMHNNIYNNECTISLTSYRDNWMLLDDYGNTLNASLCLPYDCSHLQYFYALFLNPKTNQQSLHKIEFSYVEQESDYLHMFINVPREIEDMGVVDIYIGFININNNDIKQDSNRKTILREVKQNCFFFGHEYGTNVNIKKLFS